MIYKYSSSNNRAGSYLWWFLFIYMHERSYPGHIFRAKKVINATNNDGHLLVLIFES